MTQLSFFETPFWTVTEITHYLRSLLEGDEVLQDLWVQGEVSNLSRPGSGHMYFTLKDSSCALRCVMWRNTVLRQAYIPRDGEAIEVHGSIAIYETAGQYQLYADLIRPAGEGALYQQFMRLKAKLEAEGLFAPERKRAIPRWPQVIGIVTSPTGAALRDMLNTLLRRYPLPRIVLAPTQVQGDAAPDGIVSALQSLNNHIRPDVILLARGGGSIEDLWAFNDERVARAIANCSCPVISGVGHETDFTIADFVADLRAPTPTAAAELATPNRADLITDIEDLAERMNRAVEIVLDNERWRLSRIENRLSLRSPQAQIRSGRQRLDDLLRRSHTLSAHRLQLQRTRLQALQQRLASLSPTAILQRGYAMVTLPDGRIVRSTRQVAYGTDIRIHVEDGSFGARVSDHTPDAQ
ncbi:MAG: exodeoxyribonuclease VII large subunit [Chloroflexi bacterium]|jgi:exodeoxyribonuclease VII large subunit|nr:exodeoxyribonuclease VII large subunit [Chloroflexota bacterium]